MSERIEALIKEISRQIKDIRGIAPDPENGSQAWVSLVYLTWFRAELEKIQSESEDDHK